ncbi:MAG: HNH endonuclease signature motif containing protein [Bacteroidota bacterium]
MTQKELVLSYFKKHPNKEIKHPEVVDWVTKEWEKRTGEVFRDPDRQIRALKDEGTLIKVKKGVYKYDPSYVQNKGIQNFTESQKKRILERDGYKCVICGRGEKDGVELHVDHIKPREFGGEATIENGQVLCGPHNYLKKHFKQTETGKKMFIRLYELAKKENNKELVRFCTEVLEVFEKNNINGHITWYR